MASSHPSRLCAFTLHRPTIESPGVAGGDFDHVVRGRFLLAGGGHADVARLFAQLLEVLRPEIAHAALDATDEGAEHVVDRPGNILERLDAFGSDLAGRVVLVVAITGGRAGFHRGVRTHAAILLIELAGNLHDLAWRFATPGEQAAEDDGVGQRERLHDVARLRDAAVGDEAHALPRRAL